VLKIHNDNHIKDLIVRGITNNKSSNTSLVTLNALNVMEFDTLGKTVISKKIRERRRKPLVLQILLVRRKNFMTLKVFWLYLKKF
jgi:hypothetical protein